jgi:hypothetical protein
MMAQRPRKSCIPVSMLLAMLLVFAVACGSAAETVEPTQPAAAPQTAQQQPAAQPAQAAEPVQGSSAAQQPASAPSQPAAPQAQPTATRPPAILPTPVPGVYQAEVPEWVSIGAGHHYNGVIRFVHRANPGFLDLHYGASSTTVLLPSGPRLTSCSSMIRPTPPSLSAIWRILGRLPKTV